MAAISMTIPSAHPAYKAPTTIKPFLTTHVKEVTDIIISKTQDTRLQAFLARPSLVTEIHLDNDAGSIASSRNSSKAAVDAPEVAPAPVEAEPQRVAMSFQTATPTQSLKSTSSSTRSRMSMGWKQYKSDVRATFKAMAPYHAF
ncbi:unnamed protein product [Zymoseptoria tritici ST99CH_1A5]|uniref:Uncharacterized protein n=3 Tax=Zymoseptoria tritici TaxID=1047171 RepID=F9X2Z3_ZYMTI|nr:uncharacterized protein MYCGRDRAFT_90765 [Zymoseptoria tritici IPO323]EGP90518.1 hypothetical protein MYCGRDRAFT_90765 [Zymoseptoria tritici IPO323]SMQ47652.1 unnamed protein product [Zymoseptoria tritici ST99CH_3D7]SMY21332.1 unnamed protein product [Zymoseptoria tritici ST99CH_1A5]